MCNFLLFKLCVRRCSYYESSFLTTSVSSKEYRVKKEATINDDLGYREALFVAGCFVPIVVFQRLCPEE